MRKRIKELMNKEEGFTLVELLAVIVILGIIVAIAIPAVGSVIDRAQTDSNTQEAALVEDAARLYRTTNNVPIGEEEEVVVGTETLIKNGFLENRATGEVSGSVSITKNDDGNYEYKFVTPGTPDADPLDPTEGGN